MSRVDISTVEPLLRLKSLKFLCLVNTHIGDPELEKLWALPHLDWFWVPDRGTRCRPRR
jgi:hypothetical protein